MCNYLYLQFYPISERGSQASTVRISRKTNMYTKMSMEHWRNSTERVIQKYQEKTVPAPLSPTINRHGQT